MRDKKINGIQRFDFQKKPISPCFLMSWAKYLISFPDLKKRKFFLNKINKKSYVEAEMEQILTPDAIKTMKPAEINEIVRQNFQYDDFRWQAENKIAITHPIAERNGKWMNMVRSTP